jgi:hypothetical protein
MIEPTPQIGLTEDETLAWLNLLRYAYGNRKAAVGRLLGVTPATTSRYFAGDAPTQWYWREIYRACVQVAIDQLRHAAAESRGMKREGYTRRCQIVQQRLERLPMGVYISESNIKHSAAMHRALEFMREKLPPGKKVFFRDFKEELFDKGISLKMMGRVIGILGIQKGRDEFGGASWWRIPKTIKSARAETDE